jgi:thiamine biosynthesis lipoprotein
MSDPSLPIAIDATGPQKQPVHNFERDAMACTIGIRIVEDDAKYARQAAEAAFSEIQRTETLLSRFIPTSDIARINALQPGQTERVSLEAIECLQLASGLFVDTQGAFDVAYGGEQHTTPPLVLDPENHAVGVLQPGVKIDLGGIGKGYAIDRAVAVLREWSIKAGIVHTGQSTVFAFGDPSSEQGWRVGLRHPLQADDTLATLTLNNQALSGSGQLLHKDHIIDPRARQPAATQRGAWAVAENATVADALSTAFMIMSDAEIDHLCGRRKGVTAILLSDAAARALLQRGVPIELSEA